MARGSSKLGIDRKKVDELLRATPQIHVDVGVCARQRCARSQVQPKPLATGIKIVIRRGSSIDWWRYETGFFFAGKLTGVTEAQHKLN